MQVDEDDLCDPQSKVSNMYDDFSQMSKITSPEKPNIKPSTGIYKIGKLYTFVGEFMVVEATDSMVLDLDNYVFDKEKRILGFVADVLGPVNKPYYAIKLEDLAIRTTLEMGQPIYFCDGSKLIGKDKI
jgi:rRNA processing protein Gar1